MSLCSSLLFLQRTPTKMTQHLENAFFIFSSELLILEEKGKFQCKSSENHQQSKLKKVSRINTKEHETPKQCFQLKKLDGVPPLHNGNVPIIRRNQDFVKYLLTYLEKMVGNGFTHFCMEETNPFVLTFFWHDLVFGFHLCFKDVYSP